MFWFSGPGACGILAPRLEFEPSSSALEGKVLITRPQGKSPEDPLLSSLTWLLAGGDREKERQGDRDEEREHKTEVVEFFINEFGGAPYHHFCHILLVIRTNPWCNKGGG